MQRSLYRHKLHVDRNNAQRQQREDLEPPGTSSARPGVKPLDFTAHALKQMQRRGITETDIDHALAHRAGPPGPGEPGTMWISGYAAGGRILKVCVEVDDATRIITAAWPDR